jgi:opacity protein-like surface antigen
MNRFHGILITLVSCAVIAPSLAAADDFVRFGPYLGLNGAFGYPLFEDKVQDSLGPVLGADTQLDYTWGLNARAGVRLLSFLAVEAQYEWMQNFQIQPSNAGIPDIDLMGNTLTGNLKLYIPIRRIQPYFLAGFGFTNYKVEVTGFGSRKDTYFAGRLGAGADVYITKHWAVNAEASALLTASDLNNLPNNLDSLDGLHYISASVGLMYRF